MTPDSIRENGEVPDFGSPITVLKKPAKALCFDLETSRNQDPFASIDDSSSPRTPKDCVFDPFAPGPAHLALAPLCKKYFDKSRVNVVRRLSFDSSYKIVEDAGFISDEEMFDAVYENLLAVIVTKQAEDALSEISNIECDFDACQTPPLAPRLTGIADTCPGAPVKLPGKSRNLDLGLCRKLDF
ncbi:cyclin-dependent protein kinase inhibitor SMR11-like isoform X2 [Tripterygium wilfordii]|nr:cyclin-dependent protein kinase inhibitor SMR11-like isoform X2 [Tripterygium wilfordii]